MFWYSRKIFACAFMVVLLAGCGGGGKSAFPNKPTFLNKLGSAMQDYGKRDGQGMVDYHKKVQTWEAFEKMKNATRSTFTLQGGLKNPGEVCDRRPRGVACFGKILRQKYPGLADGSRTMKRQAPIPGSNRIWISHLNDPKYQELLDAHQRIKQAGDYAFRRGGTLADIDSELPAQKEALEVFLVEIHARESVGTVNPLSEPSN